jgi:hypothetical protein
MKYETIRYLIYIAMNGMTNLLITASVFLP